MNYWKMPKITDTAIRTRMMLKVAQTIIYGMAANFQAARSRWWEAELLVANFKVCLVHYCDNGYFHGISFIKSRTFSFSQNFGLLVYRCQIQPLCLNCLQQ